MDYNTHAPRSSEGLQKPSNSAVSPHQSPGTQPQTLHPHRTDFPHFTEKEPRLIERRAVRKTCTWTKHCHGVPQCCSLQDSPSWEWNPSVSLPFSLENKTHAGWNLNANGHVRAVWLSLMLPARPSTHVCSHTGRLTVVSLLGIKLQPKLFNMTLP